LRDFNPAYVASGSVASDRYGAGGRGMSASLPIASALWHRGEMTLRAKSGCEQVRQMAGLFDHLGGKVGSALRGQNDAEYNALVRAHLSWSADVSATIGCDRIVDLVVGNRRPCTVHFNFVVVANHATLGRPTIH